MSLWRDGRPAEQPPPVNVVRIRKNGPYVVHAEIELLGHGRMLVGCRLHAQAHFLPSVCQKRLVRKPIQLFKTAFSI